MWLTHIDCWHWWMLAGMFMLLELGHPRFFFLLLGIVASALGFLVFAFPALSFTTQGLVFAGLGSLVWITWRRQRQS